MKPFESFIASQLDEYILYRRSIGFTNGNLTSPLHAFDRYIRKKEANWDTFTPAFFLKLRKELKGDPRTVNGILSVIRGFFQYLLRKGIYEENPLQDIPPHAENAYIPFIFSLHEIEQMLRSIQKKLRKTPKHFLKDLSIYVATLLLARCGMRISEPLRLRLEHYRSREGTIYIEKTKFSKDRLIPIPITVINEISNYLSVRNYRPTVFIRVSIRQLKISVLINPDGLLPIQLLVHLLFTH
ncbi:MAG: tyrosine-type recombinase/integrase [Deltaproteobacteria bacterium]|nr:tyrosine-type recombinase/integrase [Deltaproteobacteria bacterium]